MRVDVPADVRRVRVDARDERVRVATTATGLAGDACVVAKWEWPSAVRPIGVGDGVDLLDDAQAS